MTFSAIGVALKDHYSFACLSLLQMRGTLTSMYKKTLSYTDDNQHPSFSVH